MSNKHCATVLLVVLCLSIALHGQGVAPGLYFGQSLGVSYNPLGVLTDSRMSYRTPLIGKPGLLWETTKLEAGVQNEWTPADNLVAFRMTIEPVAFFDIVLKAGYYAMYNELGYGCFRMASARSGYGPDEQKGVRLSDASGYWLSAAPTLKAKVGPLVMVNTFTINGISLGSDGYFLEVRSYLPHRASGIDFVNDLYLLAEMNQSVMYGLTYRYADVPEVAVRSQRVSAVGIYKAPGGRLKGMYAALTAGVYTDDPLFAGNIYLGGLVGWETGIRRPRSEERTGS